jgi:hypothetical protein
VPREKLPVLATAKAAIKLPLIHWREFLRFASILIAIKYTSALISAWSAINSSSGLNQRLPLWLFVLLLVLTTLAVAVAVVPFAVAWTRLTVNGPNAVSHRPIWTFSGTERGVVIAALLLPLITLAPSLLVFGFALVLRTQNILMVTLIVIAIALFIGGCGCLIRLSFIVVELALQRYRSPRTSWDQTRNNIWRLIGLGFVAAGPFFLVGAIFQLVGEQLEGHIMWLVLVTALQTVFSVLGHGAGDSAVALAYKLTAPEPETAAAVTS